MENQIIYDPTKSYKWEKDAEFSFTGLEYGFIFNSLMSKRKELLAQLDVLNILEAKLKKAVESGTAYEIQPMA